MYYNIFLKTSVHIYTSTCCASNLCELRIRPTEIAELLCMKILCCECNTRDYYVLWHAQDIGDYHTRDIIKLCKFYDRYILYIINEGCIREANSFYLHNIYL